MNLSVRLQAFFSEIRQSVRLSLPLIASDLVQASSGFLGTLMIAHLGRDPLAASALGASVYWTLVVFLFGILSSISVLVSQNHGAKNKKGIELAVSQGLILSVCCAIPMMLIVWFGPLAFELSGETSPIVHLATSYLHALNWCILPLSVLIAMEQFLIGMSRTRLVLWISLAEVPFEILASYVLVFGKFGFPKCGVAGIGYGFCAVFVATAIGVGLYLCKAKAYKTYKIFSNVLRINGKYFSELLKVGWPVGCMYVIEVALIATIAFLMGRVGSNQLASYQLARQYLMLGMMFVFAISQATTVRVGQAVGRQDKPAISLAVYANMFVGVVVTFAIAVLFLTCAKSFIDIDINVNNPYYSELLSFAKVFLMFCCFSLIFDNVRFIAVGALRGLKDTMVPMYISFITFWLIGLPVAYVLAFYLHMGGDGLWIGLLTGIFSGAVILLIRFRRLLARVDIASLLI